MTAKWMVIVLGGLAVLPCPSPAIAQTAGTAVVVSEKNRTREITLDELRKVFRGERRSWAVGMPIKLIVRDQGTPERVALLKLLGMSESEYKQYWIAQIFRGEAEAEPIALPSLGMQMEALTVFSGGITFVSAATVKPGMRVLKVDGHLPGDSGYPLH